MFGKHWKPHLKSCVLFQLTFWTAASINQMFQLQPISKLARTGERLTFRWTANVLQKVPNLLANAVYACSIMFNHVHAPGSESAGTTCLPSACDKDCKPCLWFRKPQGCRNGVDCSSPWSISRIQQDHYIAVLRLILPHLWTTKEDWGVKEDWGLSADHGTCGNFRPGWTKSTRHY